MNSEHSPDEIESIEPDAAAQLAPLPLELAGSGPDAAALKRLEYVLEALLLAADQPLSIEQLHRLLGAELGVGKKDLRTALDQLGQRIGDGASELKEVGSGYRIQVKRDYAEWVGRLWQEKPPKYSRALLETLSLICYRQPITRGEIEDVRGKLGLPAERDLYFKAEHRLSTYVKLACHAGMIVA